MNHHKMIAVVMLALSLVGGALAINATGGTMSTDGAYTVLTFTTNGSLNVSSAGTFEILIVGGGGGGGDAGPSGGGGGGGGVLYGNLSINIGNYTVVIGTGGAGGPADTAGSNGMDTTVNFSSIATATGGGGGAGSAGALAKNGGSGGGTASVNINLPGNTSQANYSTLLAYGTQGGRGLAFTGGKDGGGGGGGAGQGGRNATNDVAAGDGGNGTQININGTLAFYAGGGGGAVWTLTPGKGGQGGGGIGGVGLGGAAGAGVANTGGGGGGASDGATGKGGSGVVIVRFIATAGPTVVTASLTNDVDASTWANTVSFSNAIGNLTFKYFNITSTGFCVNYTGNGSAVNCTTGNGASQYYNVSVLSVISGTASVTASTYASILAINATQLFTLVNITVFNATNNKVANTTSTTTLFIHALNGTNNVKIDVAGNYSVNYTCTATALQTSNCVVPNIYDDLFTIGAAFGANSVNNFTVNVTNTTLGGALYGTFTSNGSIDFPLLQGYWYNFFINAANYSLLNKTLLANATTNRYNFSLLQTNTFDIRFYNESTGNLLSNTTVQVQFISDTFSSNYTTTNGALTVGLLVPGAYTIRYWIDQNVPRDYYVTLVNQSYNNLSLYTIDTGVSSNYIAIVNSENTRPVSGVTVTMYRGFIENSQYVYKVVQMATTDTNGQAVLRVVPNAVFYKLLISSGGFSTITTPTQFTASTNTYTLSFTQNFLTSIVGMPSVLKSLSYVNSTRTYVFTWADTSNLVTQGCLYVTRSNNTGVASVYSTCQSGASGSLTYQVAYNNQTSYSASATLGTNTQYSTYTFGPLTVDFSLGTTIFGLVGILLTLVIIITLGFVAQGAGTDTMIITALISLIACGMIGFVGYAWESVVGFVIIGAIIILRSNR